MGLVLDVQVSPDSVSIEGAPVPRPRWMSRGVWMSLWDRVNRIINYPRGDNDA